MVQRHPLYGNVSRQAPLTFSNVLRRKISVRTFKFKRQDTRAKLSRAAAAFANRQATTFLSSRAIFLAINSNCVCYSNNIGFVLYEEMSAFKQNAFIGLSRMFFP